jgi:hypothetical protein
MKWEGIIMTPQIPETGPDFDRTRLIERPDGFYWQSTDGGREYGPFASLIAAVEDMAVTDTGDDDTSLQEAEEAFGVAEWLDAETGAPAEDSVPRLEDH